MLWMERGLCTGKVTGYAVVNSFSKTNIDINYSRLTKFFFFFLLSADNVNRDLLDQPICLIK